MDIFSRVRRLWCSLWGKRYKTFFFVTYMSDEYARVLALGKPFPPNLMFAKKARAYPSGSPFRYVFG
jgi:hypothetical protein